MQSVSGKFKLIAARGHHIVLSNILYVPNSTIHLLSIGAICDDLTFPQVTFDDSSICILRRNGSILATSTRLPNSHLYIMDSSPSSTKHKAFLSQYIPMLKTWHCHLHHANYCIVYDMACSGHSRGMPIDLSSHPLKCQPCLLGKQTCSSVPKMRVGPKATRRLELIFMDVVEQFNTHSASGHMYSLDILDDCSSKRWVIPLPSKADMFPRYHAWQLAHQVKTGETVGIVQINSGELESHDMQAFLASQGTTMHHMAPYTSAHNGQIEPITEPLPIRLELCKLLQIFLQTITISSSSLPATFLIAHHHALSLII